MGFLQDRKILVTGMLSSRSIACGIARACHREGAQLAFTFQGERVEERVRELAAEFGSDIVIGCDVSRDEEISGLFEQLGKHWDGLDGLVQIDNNLVENSIRPSAIGKKNWLFMGDPQTTPAPHWSG